MSSLVSPPFAALLEARRDEWNARFVQARRRWPTLEAAGFTGFLRTVVDQIVRSVATVDPTRVLPVTSTLWDAGLELAAQRLVGPGARHPYVERGLVACATTAAKLFTRTAERLVPALANAFHTLATVPGARPESFVVTLAANLADCADADEVLRVGQVLAWRNGLAHFRAGALAVARTLPERLARQALALPATLPLAQGLDRLDRDRWFDPAAGKELARPRAVHSVGAFRGFGGLFTLPPVVRAVAGAIVVHSGADAYLLSADAFGATLHRFAAAPHERAPETAVPNGLETLLAACAHLGPLTSAARQDTLLALTFAHTHAVTLVALAGP